MIPRYLHCSISVYQDGETWGHRWTVSEYTRVIGTGAGGGFCSAIEAIQDASHSISLVKEICNG